MPQQPNYIVLGKIGAPYGIAGYNHIQSYSDPVEDILTYQQWMIRKNENSQLKHCSLEKGRVHAQGIVAKLEGVSDRDAAQLLTGCEIVIDRDQLPALPEGEYYWHDLEGLTVETILGVVFHSGEFLQPRFRFQSALSCTIGARDRDQFDLRWPPMRHSQ